MRTLLLILIAILAFPLAAVSQAPPDSARHDSLRQNFVLDSLRMQHELDLARIHAENRHPVEITPESVPVIGVMIPIIALLGAFLVIWRDIEAKRALRLAMIERDMDPSILSNKGAESTRKYASLRIGMLMLGIGIGLLAGIGIVQGAMLYNETAFGVIVSSCLLCGGLSLTIYHHVVGRQEDRQARGQSDHK